MTAILAVSWSSPPGAPDPSSLSLYPVGFLALTDTLPAKFKLTSNNRAKKGKFRKFYKTKSLFYIDLPFFDPAISPKSRR
jgi:hypothetical protein